jgi:hypothetical protein
MQECDDDTSLEWLDEVNFDKWFPVSSGQSGQDANEFSPLLEGDEDAGSTDRDGSTVSDKIPPMLDKLLELNDMDKGSQLFFCFFLYLTVSACLA